MTKIAALIFILILSSFFVSGCVATSKTEAKDAALKDCVSRAKECAMDVPAFEYELQSQCNKVYRIANSPEEITNVSKGFC
ncbi:MAG: hypothetical protein AABX14_01060 [Candidatus Aenigmatarchaeota archaeon]